MEPSLVGPLVIDSEIVPPEESCIGGGAWKYIADVLNLQVNTSLKLLCNLRTNEYMRNSRKNSKYRLVCLGTRGGKVNRRVELLHRFRDVLYENTALLPLFS